MNNNLTSVLFLGGIMFALYWFTRKPPLNYVSGYRGPYVG